MCSCLVCQHKVLPIKWKAYFGRSTVMMALLQPWLCVLALHCIEVRVNLCSHSCSANVLSIIKMQGQMHCLLETACRILIFHLVSI